MSEVQDIFDKVIEGEYYCESFEDMCLSLKVAFEYEYITYGEYMYAFEQIKRYMGVDLGEGVRDVGALVCLLRKNNLPHSFEDTLAIYKDWENKPTLKETI